MSPSPLTIVGVDPGDRDTGIVAVRTIRPRPPRGPLAELLRDGIGRPLFLTVTRAGATRHRHAGLLDLQYLDAVAGKLDELMAAMYGLNAAPDVVAIEDVIGPHKVRGGRVIDPSAAVATGIVAGRVVGWAEGTPVETVMPGNNGGGLEHEYPRELHDPMGGCKGGTLDARCTPGCIAEKGKRRHLRSAFDVAVKAAAELDLRARIGADR